MSELYELRQLLYRCYDIEQMNDYQINDLKKMYNIIKKYDLEPLIVDSINNSTDALRDRLEEIRREINDKLVNAKNEERRNLVSKQLSILSLIAIVRADSKNALRKIRYTNQLIDEGLLDGNVKEKIARKRGEVEEEIIRIKQSYYQT